VQTILFAFRWFVNFAKRGSSAEVGSVWVIGVEMIYHQQSTCFSEGRQAFIDYFFGADGGTTSAGFT
jgi:hypothetical protein